MDGETSEETEVAAAFNSFFVEKIKTLKSNIDSNQIRDPLERISERVKNKNLKFSLKEVPVKAVQKIMKKMSKKKSKGKDGISQECLLLGHEALAAPLTDIIILLSIIIIQLSLFWQPCSSAHAFSGQLFVLK